MEMMHTYVWIIFTGIFFVFLYNYFAYLLRAVGNSVVPLYFLGSTAVLNVVLDLIFVTGCRWGIAGAAAATVIAQAVSGLGLMTYTWVREPQVRFSLLPFAPALGLLLSPVLLDLSLLFPALGPVIRWMPVTLYLRAGGGVWGDGLVLTGGGVAILALLTALERRKT